MDIANIPSIGHAPALFMFDRISCYCYYYYCYFYYYYYYYYYYYNYY